MATVHEVLDRGPGQRLWGTQRSWRRLVGRGLGEVTACLGVNPEGALRIMAGNDATRVEILARGHHIVAAWNTLANEFGTRPAQTLVCWVNKEVGRRSMVRAAARPQRRAKGARAEPPTSQGLGSPIFAGTLPSAADLGLGSDADPELVDQLARLAQKRAGRR